jgi:CarD family transcriptional regulator
MPAKSALKKKPTAKIVTKPVQTKATAKTPLKSVGTKMKAAPAKTTAKAVSKVVAKTVAKAVTKTVTKAIKAPVKVVTAAVKKVTPANNSQKPAKVTKMTKPEAPVQQTAKTLVKAPAKPAKNDNAATAYAYKAGDKVVYPAHGVGRVEGVEKLTVAGVEVTLYTITFEKDRMRLKLPLQKIATSGLRRLASKEQMGEVFQTMKGRARIRRVMWSRRAQEYEAKINSGNPLQVAEVLRDLKRNVSSTEHSYSERQVFQQALERLASEYAAIENIAEDKAAEKLQTMLVDAA